MKRHVLDILRCVLYEGANSLQIDPSRSWKRIQDRYEHEGKSYLSISLPAMHDDFIEAIDAGRWLGSRLFGVEKGRPVFLREILQLVFNFGAVGNPLKQGKKADEAVFVIRQILVLFKKQKALPNASRSAKAVDSFFEIEEELRSRRTEILSAWTPDHDRICSILFGQVFSNVEDALVKRSYVFKNGPGSVADMAYGIRKYKRIQHNWTARLDKVFDYEEVCFANIRHFLDFSVDQLPLRPRDERAMRVIMVPKTQKTPRIIAADTTVNQFVQQGIHRLILNQVKHDDHLRFSIDWTDQSRQRKLAKLGSIDGSVATLDLSEASDRVHVSLVARLLKRHPILRKAVFACRTTRADFSGRTIYLEKFAPMGSALCFPFETIIFTMVVVEAVLRADGLPITRKNVHRTISRVSLYGDDIIVPKETAVTVADSLESFGLKVNNRKSFWTGEFRESCGGDYFRGTDVTPVYLRFDLLDSHDPRTLAAVISAQNQFFDKGWFGVADFLTSYHWKLRNISTTKHERYQGFMFRGFSDRPHGYDSRVFQPTFRSVDFTLRKRNISCPDGWDQLFDWFISSGDKPSSTTSQFLDRRPSIHHARFLSTYAY